MTTPPGDVKVNFALRDMLADGAGVEGSPSTDRAEAGRAAPMQRAFDDFPREPPDGFEITLGLTCCLLGSFAGAFGFCWALPNRDHLWLQKVVSQWLCLLAVTPVAIVFSLLCSPCVGAVGALVCTSSLLWHTICELLQGRSRSDKVAAALVAVGGAA